MAAMTDYFRNKLVDLYMRGVAYTAPPSLYVALYTVAPTAVAGSGTEVSGSSYARVALNPSTTNWSATNGATLTTNPSTGTTGTTSNNVVITLPTPSGSWGTIVAVQIMDAVTGGNGLLFGTLTTSLAVTGSSTPFSFPISALSLQLT